MQINKQKYHSIKNNHTKFSDQDFGFLFQQANIIQAYPSILLS